MSAKDKPTVLYSGTHAPFTGQTTRSAPTNAATTHVDISADADLSSAKLLMFISDANCYIAFGDSVVTIDTAADAYIPANTLVPWIPTGPHLGLRSVTAANANVTYWKAG